MPPYLAEELHRLGYPILETALALVRTEGSLEDCMNLNLHLRTAHKVLYSITDFPAPGPDELYEKAKKFPWEILVSPDGYFSITTQVRNDKIRDTRFAAFRLKDAIADRLKEKTGRRPDSGPERDKVVFFLHWEEQKASLFVDTSGETIAKHGYRKIPGKAPMQETLAAAVIMATKWNPGELFINPMCGSGTLGIEAALIAANYAPGLARRNFGFMHLPGYPRETWKAMVKKAEKAIRKPTGRFLLSDRDPRVIKAAKMNAEAAGMSDYIEFEVSDFSRITLPEERPGIIIFNPEYGERLGDIEQLGNVYRQLGDFLKQHCNGLTGYIFTGNPELAKKIGLRTKRKIPFYNGPIEARLLEFELYAGSKKAGRES